MIPDSAIREEIERAKKRSRFERESAKAIVRESTTAAVVHNQAALDYEAFADRLTHLLAGSDKQSTPPEIDRG